MASTCINNLSADLIDFEFHPTTPIPMLPADELFSDGKLLPLHLPTLRPSAAQLPNPIPPTDIVFSPKAPRCTTRWRDLLGFKKNHNSTKTSTNPRTSNGVNQETVTASVSTRLSLELPRLSLDSESVQNPLRVRISKSPAAAVAVADERIPARVGRNPVDSPRMDPSGRVIFQGLERSCSSPGSFNGRARAKCRGMERSFSAHVRVPSVLNVPVCSLRGSSRGVHVLGFGSLFSQAKKDVAGTSRPVNVRLTAVTVPKVAGGGRKKTVTEKVTEGGM